MTVENIMHGIGEGFRVLVVFPNSETVQCMDRRAYRCWLERQPELAKIPHVAVTIREVVGVVYRDGQRQIS